jgi:SNF2 family DNA or RNA helicase
MTNSYLSEDDIVNMPERIKENWDKASPAARKSAEKLAEKILDESGIFMKPGMRIQPYVHQVEGIRRLVERVEPEIGRVLPGCFALFDEPGIGKSKQVVDAVERLYSQGQIDTVIVVAPAYLRRLVWWHPELGELAKHLWNGVPARVNEYHQRKNAEWFWINQVDISKQSLKLAWYVTNYEFIRQERHLFGLLRFTGPKTLLVLDESSAVSNWRALQTIAVVKLRRQCGWVWLLNGTPGGPEALYSQAYVMDPKILGCYTFFHFRARYAIMGEGYAPGGRRFKQVVGWRHAYRTGAHETCETCGLSQDHRVHGPGPGMEEIQARLAPYVLARRKIDCLDLPPKLPPTTLEAELGKDEWKIYTELEAEFITWLDANTHASADQAGVRALRLCQVTGGFVGGIHSEKKCDCGDPADPDCPRCDGGGIAYADEGPRVVGDAKLRLLERWLADQEEPHLKLIVWCRFRFELQRYFQELERRGGYALGVILGGQRPDEREEAVRLLDPRFTPAAPVIVLGIPSAGGLGLNLTAAHHMLYASPYPSLRIRTQSEDRIHRPGQTYPVWYGDVAATGPGGQPTVDHAMIAAQRRQKNVAEWTASAWRKALNRP